MLSALAGAPTASAASWSVPSSAAPTIATALERAADGDHIRIAPGTYAERLVLEKSVTLEPQRRAGADPASPPTVIIDGSGIGRVLSLKSPGATVTGLALRGSGDDLGKSDACIYVHEQATGARLTGNVLTDCAFGIWVNGTAGVIVENNSIAGRIRPIFSDRGNGINLWRVKGGLIRGNRIADTRDGIYLSVTSESSVEYNHMRNLRFGVHYMYSDHNRVIGNETRDSLVGLALMFSKRLEIIANRAEGNRDNGIVFRSIYDSTIRDNRVIGNGKGFFLNDTSFNAISGNWVEGNDIGVHVTGGSGDNRITGNSFFRNRVQVHFAWRHSQHWDGLETGGEGQEADGKASPRGNYWSDYLGWDMDGDGIGDRPHRTAGTMDRLIFRYPSLKVLATSPVVLLLQALEARFPVLRPPGVIDRQPLFRRPSGPPPSPPPGNDSAGVPASGPGGKA